MRRHRTAFNLDAQSGQSALLRDDHDAAPIPHIRNGASVFLIASCVLVCSCNVASDCAGPEPFVLAREGRAMCRVVRPKSRDKLVELALRDLVDYVEKSTGAKLQVDEERKAGEPTLELRLATPETTDKAQRLPRHAFRYRVNAKRVVIVGAGPSGLAKGVHWFLRTQLGVRWFMPTELGEEVPQNESVELKPANLMRKPEFEWVRMTGNQEFLPEEVEWGVRHGDDVYDSEVRNHWFRSHNWRYIVRPTPENLRDHPEWFAREEGQPPELDPHLNVDVTNPEVLEQFVRAARGFFDTDPRRMMFSVESNDRQYYGNSKALKALRRELGPDAIGTDEFVWFCNKIAAELKKTHPGKRLGFYAYGHHMFAPRVVKPDPMLSFMMCRHGGRSCARHAITDPRNHVNARWRENFEAWCGMLSQPGYYGYWADYGWYGPTPLNRLAEDLPYLKRQSVHQLNSENRFSWATNAPYYYLALRLVQDTKADPTKILDEFYRGMYGPAHRIMERYWSRWSQAWDAAPPRDNQGYHYELTYSPELVRDAYRDLDEAERTLTDQPLRYRTRLSLARVGLVFTDHYLRMYRQADAGDFRGAIATGAQIEALIVDSAKLGRPAAFAMHPSSTKHQMSLDRLYADLQRYKKAMTD